LEEVRTPSRGNPLPSAPHKQEALPERAFLFGRGSNLIEG
jgi:hypothetical protein